MIFLLVRRINSSHEDYYNTTVILYRNLKNLRNVFRKLTQHVEKFGTAIGHGGEFDQPLQTSFGLVFSSLDSPDRPPHPGVRPHPTSSAGTFTDLSTT